MSLPIYGERRTSTPRPSGQRTYADSRLTPYKPGSSTLRIATSSSIAHVSGERLPRLATRQHIGRAFSETRRYWLFRLLRDKPRSLKLELSLLWYGLPRSLSRLLAKSTRSWSTIRKTARRLFGVVSLVWNYLTAPPSFRRLPRKTQSVDIRRL